MMPKNYQKPKMKCWNGQNIQEDQRSFEKKNSKKKKKKKEIMIIRFITQKAEQENDTAYCICHNYISAYQKGK